MRFTLIDSESVVQTNEKFRIDASQCFGTSALTNVEIEAESGAGYISVFNVDTSLRYLDWVYTTAGTKTISVRITDSGGNNTTTKSVSVVTSATDYLFSTDELLKSQEPDIMKWLPSGKSSFNFIHRRVQGLIMTDLWKSGIKATDGTKLTKDLIKDISEVQDWSTFEVLKIIFEGISNAVDDVFAEKAAKYKGMSLSSRTQAMQKLSIDYNKDGSVSTTEQVGFGTSYLRRG